MASRQAISIGFPNPNYVSETASRDTILPGEYLAQTAGGPIPPPPSTQKPWHHVARTTEDDEEFDFWLRRRRGIAAPFIPLAATKPWQRHEFPEPEPDEGLALVRRHNTTGGVPPPPPSTRLRPYLLINV
jgi:hypothetical protein